MRETGGVNVTDHQDRDKKPKREILLAFKAQCDDTVPGAVQRAEDLLNLPMEVQSRIQRELSLEQMVETWRMDLPSCERF